MISLVKADGEDSDNVCCFFGKNLKARKNL